MAGRVGLFALLAAILASSALAAPGETERRAINAHDQAWAKRINLTLKDLPAGFRQGTTNVGRAGAVAAGEAGLASGGVVSPRTAR